MSIPSSKYDMEVTARMNILYHENIEVLYTKIINWTSFVSVIFSSTAFAAVGDIFPQYSKNLIISGLMFIITSLNGAVLAFGMVNKIQIHTDLKKKWIEFIGNIEKLETQPEELKKRFFNLNASEPAPNKKQLLIAYNEALECMGVKS